MVYTFNQPNLKLKCNQSVAMASTISAHTYNVDAQYQREQFNWIAQTPVNTFLLVSPTLKYDFKLFVRHKTHFVSEIVSKLCFFGRRIETPAKNTASFSQQVVVVIVVVFFNPPMLKTGGGNYPPQATIFAAIS